jgi:hypothetical protein
MCESSILTVFQIMSEYAKSDRRRTMYTASSQQRGTRRGTGPWGWVLEGYLRALTGSIYTYSTPAAGFLGSVGETLRPRHLQSQDAEIWVVPTIAYGSE